MKRKMTVASLLLGAALISSMAIGQTWHEAFYNVLVKGVLFVGTGTPSVTQGAGDVYIGDGLEVDGAARFDGAVVLNGALTGTDLTLTGDLSVGDDATVTDLLTVADVLATDDGFVADDLIVGDTADVTALKIAGTTVNATPTEIDAVSDLSANGALEKVKVIAISSTPTGSEQDTGWDVPVNALVHKIAILTTTAEATAADKRMHVGILSSETGGDTDGFAAGVTVDTVGITETVDTLRTLSASTAGVADHLYSTTRGVLLGQFIAGADIAGRDGISNEVPWPALATKGRSLVYDVEGADWGNWRGSIIVYYTEVP